MVQNILATDSRASTVSMLLELVLGSKILHDTLPFVINMVEQIAKTHLVPSPGKESGTTFPSFSSSGNEMLPEQNELRFEFCVYAFLYVCVCVYFGCVFVCVCVCVCVCTDICMPIFSCVCSCFGTGRDASPVAGSLEEVRPLIQKLLSLQTLLGHIMSTIWSDQVIAESKQQSLVCS